MRSTSTDQDLAFQAAWKHPNRRSLKLAQNNYGIVPLPNYPFKTAFSQSNSPCLHTTVDSTSGRHFEFAEFKLEKFCLNFLSFERNVAHAQFMTLSYNNVIILVPRVHDPSGLWQGSRALRWSNTGSPRFTDKSGKSDWLRIRNEYSAHAQKTWSGQSSRSLPQARRIVSSGDENVMSCGRMRS